MKNRLKVLRAERDWSQADLAVRLEVSRQICQRDRDGEVRSQLAAGVQAGAAVWDED